MNRHISYPLIAIGIGTFITTAPSRSADALPSPNVSSSDEDAVSISAKRLVATETQSRVEQHTPERMVERIYPVSFTNEISFYPAEFIVEGSVRLTRLTSQSARESTEVIIEKPTGAIAPGEVPPMRKVGSAIESDPILETVQSVENQAIETAQPIDEATPTIESDTIESDTIEANTVEANTVESDTIESESSASTPLDPDSNPLFVPTQPEQVRIVDTQAITLEQAVELAFRNNPELQIATLELTRNQAAVREARAALLPTLDFRSGLTIQETQENSLTDQLSQLLPEQDQPEQDDADINVQGTLRLDYDLYTGGRRSALIRAAEARVRLQELQVEVVSEQLRLDVTSDYYDLQEADEQVRIARASLVEAQQNLRDTQALEQAGVGTRFDVLQSEVNLANIQQELTQALSVQRTAQRQLAQRLNLASQVDIATADPIAPTEAWELSLEDSIVLSFQNRAELQQQLLQREINQEQRRVELAQNRPQVSLFAQYDVSDVLNRDEDVDGTYSFGVQMSWQLFDGGASRARADQSETDILIAEQRFADTRNQIRFQVEEAFLSLQANQNNINTAQLAIAQATEALRLARLRFQAGVGTQTDVLRSQTELTRAQVNLLRATLGYNRSLVTLRRAVNYSRQSPRPQVVTI
ncbi:TolC family protein [Oscillatoria sp. FACHB-1407]|uniref:TolC family protein n=1 Tax=Oscillatoria sp. FACHB-1407 TaxID=2692847 RepID=UPI00168A2339|nr:TolC family protein [Oscillatoria sp. FACHB-1407]MBD2463110.1 TolC family protein [Oscillatoria sp. FACHB-1407]